MAKIVQVVRVWYFALYQNICTVELSIHQSCYLSKMWMMWDKTPAVCFLSQLAVDFFMFMICASWCALSCHANRISIIAWLRSKGKMIQLFISLIRLWFVLHVCATDDILDESCVVILQFMGHHIDNGEGQSDTFVCYFCSQTQCVHC